MSERRIPDVAAPPLVWYRSLYWRIALGFIAFLAVLLIAQSLLFVWLAGRTGALFPATSNARLADVIASDLRDEMERNPATDLGEHIAREYGRVVQPFVVVLPDRTYSNRPTIPPGLARTGRNVLTRISRGRPIPRRLGPDGRGFFSPVIVNGALAALVVVAPGSPPPLAAFQAVAPTMAVTGFVLLVIGAAAAATLIARPVRRRLDGLARAAARIGSGDTTARATETGGDEVAALAMRFNRMAADLKARADALSASDRARRQLLADVSHELMTPLTAMRGYLETLAMPELQLDADTRARYVRIVDEETRRLEHIVGDLLELARLEGGGGTLRREPVSIDALFARVAARHERESRERNIVLATEVMPGAGEIIGDPDRLEQALQNLAANALRHTPPGGSILLQAASTVEAIKLTVRDSGPGIADEHLPLIFDRFYKADVARASGGSGLGLSIVRGIVEAHGGTITARNDGGAVFELTLPRR
jgi:signal transduction histidine kinase